MRSERIRYLRAKAIEIRRDALEMIYRAGSGHPGGSLSVAEILACLYFDHLRIDPGNPAWPERDRLVLSKGHGCPALYAALAGRGYFSREEFQRFRRLGGLLEGHPHPKIPGVEAVSGSLGMGLSQGLGMALGARFQGRSFRVYVLLGDGDMEEGATWEALMAAGYHRMGNLVALLDSNGRQGEGRVGEVMEYRPALPKVEAFGWQGIEIDGHRIEQILEALEKARQGQGQPIFILAHTIKGKGVSFMEDVQYWHGSVGLSDQQFSQAMRELDQELASLQETGEPHLVPGDRSRC